MWRLIGILVTVLFAVAAAVVTWPQFFRLERTYPLAQIVSLRGPVVIAFAVIAVVALLLAFAPPLRGFAASIVIVSVLAVLANVAVLALRGTGSDQLPERTATSLQRTAPRSGSVRKTPSSAGRAIDVCTLPS